jgi:hypothetical protein
MVYKLFPVIRKDERKPKVIKGKEKAYKFLEKILSENDLQVKNVIKRSGKKEFICQEYGSRIFVEKIQ